MTKKHFIKLADTIRLYNNRSADPFTPQQIQELARFCKSQNGQFNLERWLDYIAGKCGPSGGALREVHARRGSMAKEVIKAIDDTRKEQTMKRALRRDSQWIANL